MNKPEKNPKKVAAGRIGGLAKSEAKSKAAKANRAAGKGRPKGIPTSAENARKAANARAAKLSPERRREIALKAVAARETKRKKDEPTV